MKRILIVFAAIVPAILPFSGCSYISVLRTQELYAVRDSLNNQISVLRAKVDSSQQQQDEMLRLIRADQQVRFSELEKEISEVGSNLSESQYRLSKIYESTSDFQKELQTKLAADSAAETSHKSEIEKLFQTASADFSAGRFDIAKSEFQDLYAKFPDSPQGQESQFWVAECLSAKKEYDPASSAYLLYIRNFPDGTKSCTALYKLGLCYGKLDKKKSQDLVWKKLLDKYPDSEEAKLVKSRK